MGQHNPESVTGVELPIGSGEVVKEGYVVTIHEVSTHAVTQVLDREYGLVQVPVDVDFVRTKLDTIDTACRQTLNAFNTFVCGITTVCLLNRRYLSLD